jgi:hypothetical protein
MSLHGRKELPVGSSISSLAGAPVIRGDAKFMVNELCPECSFADARRHVR